MEDLFLLPLSQGEINLRELTIAVNKNLAESNTDVPDFLTDEHQEQTEDQQRYQLQLDILKDVIETRKEEIQAAIDAHKRNQERAAIRDLIAKKKQGNLEGLSLEELEEKLQGIN